MNPHSADVEGSGDSRGSELGNVVTSVAFSHEGQYLAFGLSNGTIYIRDVVTDEVVLGTKQLPLTGHTNLVSSLSFSRDGKQLISGSAYCTVCIWDLNTSMPLTGPFGGHNNPISAFPSYQDMEHFFITLWVPHKSDI